MRRVLEFFKLTKPEYYADFFITPPLTVVLAVVSIYNAWSWRWPLWCAAGLLAWTFYEYAVHRWVSHRLWFFKQAHALHHDNQKDFIAVPPLATLVTYVGIWLAFGLQSSAFSTGFSVGYIIYSALHTLFHYAHIPPGHVLFEAKRRHALHHRDEASNFGVSLPLWDTLFGTRQSDRQKL